MGGALEVRNKKLRCIKCLELRRILLKPVLPEPKIEILCHCHNVIENLFDYCSSLKKAKNFKYICQKCYSSGIKHPRFCYECLKVYCEKCYSKHLPVKAKVKQKRPSLKGHKTILIEKFDFFCINHQEEKYIGFCHACKLNICEECLNEGIHNDHDCKNYKDLELTKEQINEIKNDIKKAEKKNQNMNKQIKSFLSKNKELVNYQQITENNKLVYDTNNYILELVKYSYNLYDGKPKNYTIIFNLLNNSKFNNEELILEKGLSPEEKEEKIMDYLKEDAFVLKRIGKGNPELLEINNKWDEEDEEEEFEEGEEEEEEDEENDNKINNNENKIIKREDDDEEEENKINEEISSKTKETIIEEKEDEKEVLTKNVIKPKKIVSIFDDTEESPPPSPKRKATYKSDDSYDSPKEESPPKSPLKMNELPEVKIVESQKIEKEKKIVPSNSKNMPKPPPPPLPKQKIEEKKEVPIKNNNKEEEKKKNETKKEPSKPEKRELPKYFKDTKDSGYKNSQPNKIHLPSIYTKKKEIVKERKNIINTGAVGNISDKKNFIHQMMINTGFTFGKRKTPAEIKQEKIEHEVHEAGRVSEIFKKAPVVKKKKKKPKKKFSE